MKDHLLLTFLNLGRLIDVTYLYMCHANSCIYKFKEKNQSCVEEEMKRFLSCLAAGGGLWNVPQRDPAWSSL